MDSGGSWYSRLLDLRLLVFLPSFIAASLGRLRDGADLVLAAKERVRGRSREDSLAVLQAYCSPDRYENCHSCWILRSETVHHQFYVVFSRKQ